MKTCEWSDSYGQCTRPAAYSVGGGCVHEHVATAGICHQHRPKLDDGLTCHRCRAVDGHTCEIRIIEIKELMAS